MPITRRVAILTIAAALPACSPLSLLNTLGTKDSGSRKIATDLAYGPDGRQRLDIYAPEGFTPAQPVAIFYYGGAWNSGSKDDYAFVGRALASRGFVTVVCDYRLVPEVRFPSFIDDCAGVVRWTSDHIAEYGGSRGKLHLIGHSAGAYNALMVALDTRYLARVGLMTNVLRNVVGLSGPYDFLPLRVDAARAAFEDATNLRNTQPIAFARSDAPPIFLATGSKDTTVEAGNTLRLADAIRKRHGRVFVRTYAGLSHADTVLAFSTTFRTKAPVLDDVVQFMSTL